MSRTQDLHGEVGAAAPVAAVSATDSRSVPASFTVGALASADQSAFYEDGIEPDRMPEGEEEAMATKTTATPRRTRSAVVASDAAPGFGRRSEALVPDWAPEQVDHLPVGTDAVINRTQSSATWAVLDLGDQPRLGGELHEADPATGKGSRETGAFPVPAELTGSAAGLPGEARAGSSAAPRFHKTAALHPMQVPAEVGEHHSVQGTPTSREERIGSISVGTATYEAHTRCRSTGGTVQMVWLKCEGETVAKVLGFVRGVPFVVVDEGQSRPWPADQETLVLAQVLELWHAAGLTVGPHSYQEES